MFVFNCLEYENIFFGNSSSDASIKERQIDERHKYSLHDSSQKIRLHSEKANTNFSSESNVSIETKQKKQLKQLKRKTKRANGHFHSISSSCHLVISKDVCSSSIFRRPSSCIKSLNSKIEA